MTIGLFVTLMAALTSVFAAFIFASKLRQLPTRMEPGYDAWVAKRATALRLVIASELALPFIVYAVFSQVDPELFRTALF